MPKSLKEIRERLWYKNPHCVYCGVLTVLPSSPLLHRSKTGVLHKIPPNLATIDHLRSRLDPKRRIHKKKEKRYVLACATCNNLRAKDEVSKTKIERLWELSKRYPFHKRVQEVREQNLEA